MTLGKRLLDVGYAAAHFDDGSSLYVYRAPTRQSTELRIASELDEIAKTYAVDFNVHITHSTRSIDIWLLPLS